MPVFSLNSDSNRYRNAETLFLQYSPSHGIPAGRSVSSKDLGYFADWTDKIAKVFPRNRWESLNITLVSAEHAASGNEHTIVVAAGETSANVIIKPV